jgi:hypothetical protein
MRVLKAAFFYFVIVFGVGLVLGTVRTLWIVPHSGSTDSGTAGTPNVIVSIFAARFSVRRLPACGRAARLAMGCIALVFMLTAEFGLVLWLRGIGIREYLASRARFREPLTTPRL